MNFAFPPSVQACLDLIEGNHGSRLCDSHPNSLFLVLFPDLQKHQCLPAPLRDLNKSWLPRCLSGDTGSWRPLNRSTQTDDWLLIHSFFWKERLITIPIPPLLPQPLPFSLHPTRSCQAVKISAAASQARQIKGVCLWHFEGSLPKKKKNGGGEINYVRSPWILHSLKTESRTAIVSVCQMRELHFDCSPEKQRGNADYRAIALTSLFIKDCIFCSAVPFRTHHSESYIIDCFIFDLPLACSVCFMSDPNPDTMFGLYWHWHELDACTEAIWAIVKESPSTVVQIDADLHIEEQCAAATSTLFNVMSLNVLVSNFRFLGRDWRASAIWTLLKAQGVWKSMVFHLLIEGQRRVVVDRDK